MWLLLSRENERGPSRGMKHCRALQPGTGFGFGSAFSPTDTQQQPTSCSQGGGRDRQVHMRMNTDGCMDTDKCMNIDMMKTLVAPENQCCVSLS
jgi:hypothetical protein